MEENLRQAIAPDVLSLIGNTPLLELARMGAKREAKARVVAKLECFNPGGSAKDRAALQMIRDAEAAGILKPGATIVESTSGNTGIGLALVAAVLGYRVIICMPDSMSMERRLLMGAHGAELVLTPGAQGMVGANNRAAQLVEEIPGAMFLGQFINPSNAQAHYLTTGPEIWEATAGKVTAFVAGAGTGGTISGVGRFLKEQNADVQIVAVEPEDSPVLSGGEAGPHGLQGIGAGFVPDIMEVSLFDRVMRCTTEDAYAAARELAQTEGMLCGITSGAALWAAFELAREPEFAGKTIVALLPDTGERYLSSGLFG